MSDLILNVPDLREAINRVLAAIEAEHGEIITLPVDFYWTLMTDAATFDPGETPSPEALALGQISDDLDELAELLDRPTDDDSVAVWHDLEHIIGLLRALGHVNFGR